MCKNTVAPIPQLGRYTYSDENSIHDWKTILLLVACFSQFEKAVKVFQQRIKSRQNFVQSQQT